MLIQSSHLVLDTCCILNFIASGHFLSIITAIPSQVMITQTVWQEELIKFERFDKSDKQQLDESVNQGVVQLVDFEIEEEYDLFVNYVSLLPKGDGEAASGAIAIFRDWAIATDDKKPTKLFRQEKSNMEILSTPDIIKYWSEKDNLTCQEIKTVLTSIQVKGKYFPPKNHPLRDWWINSI